MIIDLMSQVLKPRKEPSFTQELNRLNRSMELAQAEFNNSDHPLQIEAAIFRMNELETRRRLLFVRAKLEHWEV